MRSCIILPQPHAVPRPLEKRLLKYSVDHLNSERIAGWCYNRLCKSMPVELRFYLDNVSLGTARADRYRQDLESYGLHPSGRCGFEFRFPSDQRFRGDSVLAIRPGRFRSPIEVFRGDQVPQVLTGALPRVFFMHIPKTGGTTLNAFATPYFPEGAAAVHIEVLDPAVYPELAERSAYLAGHLSREKIGGHFPGFDVVTLVRDPYRQLHSHISWIRRIGTDTNSGFFARHEPCVRDLAMRLNHADLADPASLRRLVEDARGFELDFFDNLQTRYFLDYRPDKVGPDDLDQALASTRSFALVGAVERYDEFLDRFCERYGMTRTRSGRSFNRLDTRLFDVENAAVRSALAPFVEADLALYQQVAGAG